MAADNKMKLYHTQACRSSRCTWLIEELGVQDDFEIIPYNPYQADESKSESYMSDKNFHGTIPTLVLPDGTVIVESVAITLYLAELYSFLPPVDKRADYYSWSLYVASTLDHALKVIEVMLDYTEEKQRNQHALKNAQTKWKQFAERFNTFMENRQFICGDRFSAADVNMGFSLHWAFDIQGGTLFEGYPQITSYLQRLESRPGFVKGVLTGTETLTPSNYKPHLNYVFT